MAKNDHCGQTIHIHKTTITTFTTLADQKQITNTMVDFFPEMKIQMCQTL